MTTATALGWLDVDDYAESPTPRDLHEFFGIPPSPPEALLTNIREKRKHWKKKEQKARTEDGQQRAKNVLQAIASAEDALTRGATPAAGGQERPRTVPNRAPQSADDVWRELERLLFRGRYREALDRVRQYESRWGDYPPFVDMRAEVILNAAQNMPGVAQDRALLESAIAGTRQVLAQIGPTEARYLTLVDLLTVAGQQQEIPTVFADAGRRLTKMSASFRVRELALRFGQQNWTPVLRYCVELVRQSPDDRALRSELVQLIIGRTVSEVLPLRSATDVADYQGIIATAAWIADGVPEAEDFVRFHRMWASNADQPVFGGNWQWRAFFGLITLFVALPLVNAAQSKPAWEVLLAGPPRNAQQTRKAMILSQNRTWFLVTRNQYIQPVHAAAKLPWQARADEWPQIDTNELFNF